MMPENNLNCYLVGSTGNRALERWRSAVNSLARSRTLDDLEQKRTEEQIFQKFSTNMNQESRMHLCTGVCCQRISCA